VRVAKLSGVLDGIGETPSPSRIRNVVRAPA
jgi:hypothetical protein